ncbi:uncharacterized protein LOC128852993 isoform X5 [Cuculus canorus]|uniref:uncharacterized protein LOC128852993 isoform X5 n=1 Tax=Cuculus canorus TaxID=55661 RepID=UPI0023AA8221|nr:uncharacterized protein LOC128852993 isoform X5 [Cuculus canorus]
MLIPSTWVVVEWEASFKEPWATSGPENENKITCRTKSKPDAEGRMEEILIWKLNVVCNQRIQVFGLKFSWFWRCYPNPRESHICTNTSNSISSICLSKMEVKTSTASEVNLESAAERDLLVVLLYATLLCHHWCCLRGNQSNIWGNSEIQPPRSEAALREDQFQSAVRAVTGFKVVHFILPAALELFSKSRGFPVPLTAGEGW